MSSSSSSSSIIIDLTGDEEVEIFKPAIPTALSIQEWLDTSNVSELEKMADKIKQRLGTITEDENETTTVVYCPICFENKTDSMLHLPSCEHCICSTCESNLLLKRCPMCRKAFNKKQPCRIVFS